MHKLVFSNTERSFYTFVCFFSDVTCVDGTVHLVGGDDVSRGRVEYCYDGSWHSVCSDSWESTGDEARTICQTLNYDTDSYGKHEVYTQRITLETGFIVQYNSVTMYCVCSQLRL